MKRDFLQELKGWKHSQRRKPLIIQGARQVGKTYVVHEFGKGAYENVATFNFEQDPALADLFSGALDPERLIPVLKAVSGVPIFPENTLLFFDEVQQCERALTALKYFSEQAPQYHIIAAGSLLGIRLGKKAPFPVGKVNFLTLNPMTFIEFLDARGQGHLREFIESHDMRLPYPASLQERLEAELRLYYYVGGMPESVAVFCRNEDYSETRQIQREILRAYALDFSKYTAPGETLKISNIWESVPVHLSKENKKFTFSAIKQSARSRDYEGALQWLLDTGLLLKAVNVEAPSIPLAATALDGIFKVYLFDVGLLAAMVGLDARTIVTGNELFTTFKGAFVENYVAQTLRSLGFATLNYWTSGNQAEIDFLIEADSQIIPLEVKSAFNTRAKSLQIYRQRYEPTLAIRTSLQVQQLSNGVFDCPLFALSQLKRAIETQPLGSTE